MSSAMWFVNGLLIGFCAGAVFIGGIMPELMSELKSMMSDFEWKYKSMSDKEKAEFHKEEDDNA